MLRKVFKKDAQVRGLSEFENKFDTPYGNPEIGQFGLSVIDHLGRPLIDLADHNVSNIIAPVLFGNNAPRSGYKTREELEAMFNRACQVLIQNGWTEIAAEDIDDEAF